MRLDERLIARLQALGHNVTIAPRRVLGLSKQEAEKKAKVLLERTGLGGHLHAWPSQLSGGQKQRVAIALALSGQPVLVFADEPTTALDVTVQAQVLSLLQEVRERSGAALVLVTHDLGVVAQLADRIGVMRAGRIVELGGSEDVFLRPSHPYTRSLLDSLPRL